MPSITSEIENILNGGNLIISTKIDNYEKLWTDSIEYLTEKKMQGVVISIAKSYSTLTKTFEANKINTKDITFIDSVTYNEEKRVGNCIYLEKPFNPTYVSVILEPFIKNKDIKFFIVDSISSFLMYQPLAIVKFFHFTLAQLSLNNKMGIIFDASVDMTKKEIIVISQACNKVLVI